MSLTRRKFIKLAALFTVTSIAAINGSPNFDVGKTQSVEEIISSLLQKSNGILENQTLIMCKPLSFFDSEGIIIRNCTFSPSKDFQGNTLIVLDKTSNLLIENCVFELPPFNKTTSTIGVRDYGNNINTSVKGCHFIGNQGSITNIYNTKPEHIQSSSYSKYLDMSTIT